MTQQQAEQTKSDEEPETVQIPRKNNRGCKSEEFYKWPEQSLNDMDTPLAVQQYIQQTIRKDPSNIDQILKLPEGQELGAWKVEHLRQFCMQLNRLAAKLQECCCPDTCSQMTATEQWIFLCAAHKQPTECPAIDYVRHTLDGAANLLNSNKYFPSRVTIKESSVAKLGSVCRRIYRIFSHAYYHHYQVFDEFERETHLCERFSKFVTIHELMSKDCLIVPADGSKPEPDANNEQKEVDSTEASTPKTSSQVDAADATQKDSAKVTAEAASKGVTKPEAKGNKKGTDEESSADVTQKSNWSNTMVKGLSSKSAIEENTTKPATGDKTVIDSS